MYQGGVLTQSMLSVHVSWADHRHDVNCMSSTIRKSAVLMAEEDLGYQHELGMLTVRLCKLTDICVPPINAVFFAELVGFLLVPAGDSCYAQASFLEVRHLHLGQPLTSSCRCIFWSE